MFTKYDQVGAIEADALTVIQHERQRYNDVYKIIETYTSQHGLIVGGAMAINLLLKNPRGLEDYTYELYATDAFVHANNLSNALAGDTIASTSRTLTTTGPFIIILKTSIPYHKYIITIDSRPIVTLFKLTGPSTEVSPIKIIKPREAKWWSNSGNVLVLSPQIQLIDLYRTLYSPQEADSWGDSLMVMHKLFRYIEGRRSEKKRGGGDDDASHNFISVIGGAADNKMRQAAQLAILRDFVCNNDKVVLVGRHALDMLAANMAPLNANIAESDVLSIISASRIDEDMIQLQRVTGLILQKTTRQLHILQDQRVTRTTIKIADEGGKELAYIYNIAQYDLVPVVMIKSAGNIGVIRVGNLFVLLRVLLIDVWMLRWVMAIGAIDEKFGKHRLHLVMDMIVKVYNMLNKPEMIKFIFQVSSDDYVGFYEDEVIAQKEKAKDQTKYMDYYPQMYKIKNSTYRTISAENKK